MITKDTQLAITMLKKSSVGVILTDTVYGLVASATDVIAVKKLYALKNREQKPGTIIASNTKQLLDLGIKQEQLLLVEKYWPSSISIIFDLSSDFFYLHQGLGGVAIRVISDSRLKPILDETGPLLTSSANHPGEPTAISIKEAFACFGDLADFYLDGGTVIEGLPSTILKLSENNIKILRKGKDFNKIANSLS